jgi:hypothetical protein
MRLVELRAVGPKCENENMENGDLLARFVQFASAFAYPTRQSIYLMGRWRTSNVGGEFTAEPPLGTYQGLTDWGSCLGPPTSSEVCLSREARANPNGWLR